MWIMKFYWFGLDINPMTLVLKLDLDIVKMYVCTKNETWTDTQTDTHTDRHTDLTKIITYPHTRMVITILFSGAMWFWATYFSVCEEANVSLDRTLVPFLNPIILQNGLRVNKQQLIFRWNSIFRNTNLFLVTTRLFIEPSRPLSLLGPFMSCVYSTGLR